MSKSESHSFDIRLAKQFGVQEAILIKHFQHWIRINRYHGRNIHDERCWTYQSRKDMQGEFPYWTTEDIRYLCEKLVKIGVLVTANYNKSKMDKTLWYAFADESLFGVDDESIQELYGNSNNFYEREKSRSKVKDSEEVKIIFTKGKSPVPCGKSPKAIPDTKTTDTNNPPLPPPTPPSQQKEEEVSFKDKIRKSLGDQITDQEFEEVWKEYQKNPTGKFSPSAWIKKVILNRREAEKVLQEHQKQTEEKIGKRKKWAEKNEKMSPGGNTSAEKDGYSVITGSLQRFYRYDSNHDFWSQHGL